MGRKEARATNGVGMPRLVIAFALIMLASAPFGVPAQAMAGPIKLLADNRAGPNFGGFAGYNWQFDDAIIGIEGTYNHANLTTASTATAVANILVSGNSIPST